MNAVVRAERHERPILDEIRAYVAETGNAIDWLDAPEVVRYVRDGKDDLVMLLANAVNDLGKREHTMLDNLLEVLLTKDDLLSMREMQGLLSALRSAMTQHTLAEINQRLSAE